MSNLEPSPIAGRLENQSASQHGIVSYPARSADLGGGLTVVRALPLRQQRLVGPWCFFDQFGPVSFSNNKIIDVAPHPHIGLQTVSWLFDGEVLHNDSLGCTGVARPGELNLMTAGRGIAHSEETPIRNSGILHGLQLWVALPNSERQRQASFDHYTDLPVLELGGRARKSIRRRTRRPAFRGAHFFAHRWRRTQTWVKRPHAPASESGVGARTGHH
ncbi:MAG TPA: pirin family protein [Gammaproteobacteria bacterium]|nr:pirin family protein [Gammaproteobacteria bacterium]